MRTERESAIGLLQLMMVASLVLPAALYGYASWINYRDTHTVADERITRSLDVMQEQTLKVFETVDRTFAEVDQVVHGMSDDDIRAAQPVLHPRLEEITQTMPQLQAIVLIGRDGRPLASSALAAVKPDANFADRDYFKAQLGADVGTYVSDVRTPNLTVVGNDFFDLSRRLGRGGNFKGVIAVAVKPAYFEDFYHLLSQAQDGSFFALVRDDGSILARYPERPGDRVHRLGPSSGLRVAIAAGKDRGEFTVNSEVDGVPRRIGFRKLHTYPVYALAGIDVAAINREWIDAMAVHLIFGLPATLVVFGVLWIALRRTRRLYDEAQRREAAEGALQQAQQLQVVGQLTGGVAHDFNNLLMVVSGSVQRLRRLIKDDKQIHILDAITTATERGESLTRQLLTFSRRQTFRPTVIDLAERLPELKDILSRSLRGDIEIRVGVPRRSCTVKVDTSELELALLNLAVNARDAMPSGGVLSIVAKPVTLRGKASEEGLSGEFVAIRIADTGTGIPADVLPRVFEPFFTTKDIGKGTGLGLSQVYGFAQQSGGAVAIVSSRRGTAVTLFLPRTWEEPVRDHEPAAKVAAKRHAGTVLIVEDNAEVAEVAKAYLEELGYQVKQAASAQAGLDLVAHESDINLVFSDILMPGGMNGLELAAAIRQRAPHIAVLLTTGYSSSAQDAVRQGFAVLQKPYNLAALERALRDAHRAAAKRPAATTAARAVG
jgi:two-component system, NtrC family, sensor kinase